MGIIFFAVSVLLLGYNLIESYKANLKAKSLLNEFSELIDIKKNIYFNSNMEGIIMPSIEIENQKVVGSIIIEKFNLILPVLDELNEEKLKISPCRYSGSLYDNNLIIGAHNYRSHFGKLNKLNKGDMIRFVDVDGYIYNYIVSDIEIINGNNINRLVDKKNNNNWDLSLFTCTLSRVKRYTVRCKLIKGV